MRVMRDKTGSSLVFVLAVMLLLMAIGVSVFTVAGLHLGAQLDARDRNQHDLYVSSMERTIKAALEATEPKGALIGDARTLSGWIIRDAITGIVAGKPVAPGQKSPVNVNLVMNTDVPDGINAEYTIEISGTIYVQTSPYQRYKSYLEYAAEGGVDTTGDDKPDRPATPLTMTVRGEIAVRQTTRYGAPDTMMANMDSGGAAVVTTETTYRFDGGYLVEEHLGFDDKKTDEPVFGKMCIVNPGTWTVERHETISE